ncbi:MAG: DNA primase [Dehalococcoidia bacterium]
MGVVDDIKDRLDIVDVISQYTPLRKAGRNFKAACPFHSERTPSFYVSPERQTWHCFGACGTGGDVFSFVMKQEGMEFQDALKLLAERVGVQLPQGRREPEERTSNLYRINEAAASYFHHLLLGAPEAQGARGYLETRGIDRESVERFQLGFSPPLGDGLIKHLGSQGYARDELLTAGLVTVQEGGESRDLFRGRLMFPIRDERGRLLGFGGRALVDGAPKYVNSPQTPAFDKSAILYGVDRAKAAARDSGSIVVVEGYTDVLTAHQHGFQNVVASMGTALTEKQVAVLTRLARRVYMAMDADSAGQEATLRSLESSWHAFGRKVHQVRGRRGQRFLEGPPQHTIDIILLPPGKDPDDVIRKDEKAWEALVQNAVPLMDYLIEAEVSRVDLDVPGARTAVLQKFGPLLVTTSFFDQDRYVQKLSTLLGVRGDSLERALRAAQPRGSGGSSRSKQASEVLEVSDLVKGGDPLEERVLVLLLQNPHLKPLVDGLDSTAFRRTENRQIFAACVNSSGMDEVRPNLPETLLDHYEALASRELPPAPDDQLEPALIQCVRRLEERRLKDLKVQEEHFLSQEEPQKEEASAIQKKALEVNTQLRELFSREQKITNRDEAGAR